MNSSCFRPQHRLVICVNAVNLPEEILSIRHMSLLEISFSFILQVTMMTCSVIVLSHAEKII